MPFLQHSQFFLSRQTTARIARLDAEVLNKSGEIVMSFSKLGSAQRAAPQLNFDTDRVRTLIAEYLDVDAKQVAVKRTSVMISASIGSIVSN